MASSSRWCLLVACLSLVAGVLGQNKIYGGRDVDIREVPWIVSVQYHGRHHCGGTIISDLWVLSAAHCFTGVDEVKASEVKLRVGSSSWKAGGKLYQVEQLVNHAKYEHKRIYNDISAIRLTSPLVFDGSTVVAAKLPRQGTTRVSVGTPVRVSGWGLTDEGLKPTLLKAVDISVIDFSLCGIAEGTQRTQLCAGAPGNSACHSDSGGPLDKGDELVGIVSYRVSECEAGTAVYTDVSVYREWIKDNTGV